ncbi:hypothetical protein MSAN_00634400 [Mycena sanguinolenta]|uniref:Uncharacterized protein n=1 Tax=Mycena sanguinolenta TaxID=230812 RepID=A0A8H7DC50_9AGAR|nr:hypothetical protein MSAN_00634400 [Mycena sanguinolenta]
MLVLLIAIHLLSKNSRAASLLYPLDTRTTTNSCDDINSCRTLFSVLWGCLATVFACTWVSVHPNVPPPNQSALQLFLRKLMMMLVAIIAPEIMVGFAFRQRLRVHVLSKKFQFPMTHGFFFCMGGFVSSAGFPIVTTKQLEDPVFGFAFQESIRSVNEEDIEDKSKGDALSKGIALLQGLWFTVQCLARLHQRLTLTQAEVATLAFAVVNVLIWLLWWNKPLGVQRPMVVGPPTPPRAPSGVIMSVQLSPYDRFLTAIFGFSMNQYHPLASASVPSKDGIEAGSLFVVPLIGVVFGAIHCAAWNTIFSTPVEMWIWRTSSLVITAIPGLTLLLPLIATILTNQLESVLGAVGVIVILASPIYITARLILVVLPLVDLRSLPASAFIDINWSVYIPHL